MSNYIIQGETLTSIADAIRSKTGSTDAISVGDMASSIEGIESGSAVSNTGSFTLDTDFTLGQTTDTLYSIEHGLKCVPDFFVLWSNVMSDSAINVAGYFNVDSVGKTGTYLIGASNTGAYIGSLLGYDFDVEKIITESDVKIRGHASISDCKICNGVTYSWLAVKYT